MKPTIGHFLIVNGVTLPVNVNSTIIIMFLYYKVINYILLKIWIFDQQYACCFLSSRVLDRHQQWH